MVHLRLAVITAREFVLQEYGDAPVLRDPDLFAEGRRRLRPGLGGKAHIGVVRRATEPRIALRLKLVVERLDDLLKAAAVGELSRPCRDFAAEGGEQQVEVFFRMRTFGQYQRYRDAAVLGDKF